MGAPCPHCQRITTATKSGLYTCTGCTRVFRIGPPTAVMIGIQARISQLEAIKAEIEVTKDQWLAIEVQILSQELAALRRE